MKGYDVWGLLCNNMGKGQVSGGQGETRMAMTWLLLKLGDDYVEICYIIYLLLYMLVIFIII